MRIDLTTVIKHLHKKAPGSTHLADKISALQGLERDESQVGRAQGEF